MPFMCQVKKHVSYLVQIILKTEVWGNVYIGTVLVTACRICFIPVTGVVGPFLIEWGLMVRNTFISL